MGQFYDYISRENMVVDKPKLIEQNRFLDFGYKKHIIWHFSNKKY